MYKVLVAILSLFFIFPAHAADLTVNCFSITIEGPLVSDTITATVSVKATTIRQESQLERQGNEIHFVTEVIESGCPATASMAVTDGWTLSAGENTDNVWTVGIADLPGLVLTRPDGTTDDGVVITTLSYDGP